MNILNNLFNKAVQESLTKWDKVWLGYAQLTSTLSKDPSTKVGAVLVKGRNDLVSIGYNGLPPGIEDSSERLYNREVKYGITVHAEMNALLSPRNNLESLEDCTLYVYPFQPCSNCAAVIIRKGVKRVVAPVTDVDRWKFSFALASEILEEAGVQVDLVEYTPPT